MIDLKPSSLYETNNNKRPITGNIRGVSLLGQNIFSASRALRENGIRSVLTIGGMVIGVFTIITLIAALQGVKQEITRQVEGLGANLILIVPGALNANGQPNPAYMIGVSTLTEEDVKALRKTPGVQNVSPVYIVSGSVQAGNHTATAFVVATNQAGVRMNPTRLAEGSYFQDNAGNVCILGYQPEQDLFGSQSAIGKLVHIAGRKWTVVGVMGKPSNDGTLGSQVMSLDTLVYLPSRTARREIKGCQVNRIALQTDYKHPADSLLKNITKALQKSHHGLNNFGLITQKKGLSLVEKLLNMAQSLLALIAAISLFVAGVGIMNIMLVTVTERIREIGIRKTVGARRSDIFLQFLTEALIMGIIGGCIGALLAWSVCRLISKFTPLTPLVSPSLIVMAILVSSLIGVLFGVWPAARASLLNPIDALRHE